eukprot:scaffold991_cov128-Cylindrotheca_fusiformis.AAC.35
MGYDHQPQGCKTATSLNMGREKALVTSHAVVFLLGFALGKYVDHEELMLYRDSHESFGTRWRRRAGNAALATMAIGTITVFVKFSSRSPERGTSV